MSEPPVRLGDEEDVNYDAVTTAVKKAVRLNSAIQAWDGHWPAENAGPLFFTPPLVSINCFGHNLYAIKVMHINEFCVICIRR